MKKKKKSLVPEIITEKTVLTPISIYKQMPEDSQYSLKDEANGGSISNHFWSLTKCSGVSSSVSSSFRWGCCKYKPVGFHFVLAPSRSCPTSDPMLDGGPHPLPMAGKSVHEEVISLPLEVNHARI